MKKCIALTILAVIQSIQPTSAANQAKEMSRFVTFDNQGAYQGLTPYAKQLIIESRDILKKRKHAFAQEFKEFETLFHAAQVNRLAKGNMFMYGPPGGAKSKFIKWLFANEHYPTFELQLHQMMSEAAFIGGQNFNAAKEGRFDVNTEGSLASFKVALIDEIDKGNPAALAALLSLLNERQVLAGNKVIQSELETVFSTSNANIYELYQQFTENGMRSTAAALLNRFTSIAFVPNWLPKIDQAALDKKYLNALDAQFAQTVTKVETDPALALDWEGLRTLAKYLLRPTDEFFSVSREVTDSLRSQTIDTVESTNSMLQTSEDYLPYYPTAEYTERLRERIHDIVLMSLLIDLLSSQIVDNIDNFENSLKKIEFHRLPYGPLSLWRAYLSVTTLTFGNTELVFPKTKDEKLTVSFGSFFNDAERKYKAKDAREAQTIAYLVQEQERFKKTFLSTMEKHTQALEQASAFNSLFSCMSNEFKIKDIHNIERLLATYHA